MEDRYKNISTWYDTIIEPFNKTLRKIGLKMYPVNPAMKILDIGCGTGEHLKLYQSEKCELFGIDLSESMLGIARKKLDQDAILEICDATNTVFTNNFFDLIISMTVLHEMSENVRIGVLKEAIRILKKDGRILLIDFHTGPVRKLKGFISKIVITIFEVAAGREHYKNYRHFIKNGGLPGLIKTLKLEIEDQKIVSGGNFGIFLLKLT